MKYLLMTICIGALANECARAAATNDLTSRASTEPIGNSRHGLFGWLDSRSGYGAGVFPEPFLVDDSDLETGEGRFDWLHTEAGGPKTDMVKAEVEKGFGLMTLELEVPYEWDTADGSTTSGFDNVSVGARYPIYQYVSREGFVDSTAGVGVELGIPNGSSVSKNTELVPKVFNDLKIGDFTLQSIFGYSTLFGPGPDGGLQTFEYGFVLGYTIDHKHFPVPGVRQVIPVFEMAGEREMNHADAGHNSVLGNAAIRMNLKAIGRIQPRPGVGFVFPMNSGAREEIHWGVFTSMVFEF